MKTLSLSLVCCGLKPRGRLRLTGEDRVRFLNGQVTNNVKSLAPNEGCYAAFTNAKGKMRADAVILNHNGALWLDLEPGTDDRLVSELEKFLIADDVTIENISRSWSAFAILGEDPAGFLSDLNLADLPSKRYEARSLPSAEWGEGFVYRSHRSTGDAFDLWVEQSREAELEAALKRLLSRRNGAISDPSLLEIFRVEAGIPRFGAEMDENTLPPEAIETEAISYNKGCYLGQEVIARIKSVGHVNRTLVRLMLPEKSNPSDPLNFNGKEVGRLGSAVLSPRFGKIGLAIIRREASAPSSLLTLPGGAARIVENFG